MESPLELASEGRRCGRGSRSLADNLSRSVADIHPDGNHRGTSQVKREGSGASATSHSDVAANNWRYQGTHIGYTTELDPLLFDVSPSGGTTYQRPDGRNAFLIYQPENQRYSEPPTSLIQSIDRLVGSHAAPLIQHFRTINRSLPIVEDSFFENYCSRQRNTVDPALLCAVYIVSAASAAHNLQDINWQQTDLTQLEDLAFNLFDKALSTPTLSTIQAGLLLMQRSHVESKMLNTQLVGAAFELGLHLDCSSWTISAVERGLRKRLAWALYMEDQWCSLVHGRPSLISKTHWAVLDLSDEDFEETNQGHGDDILEEAKRGQDCFCQMVVLTGILSNILNTLYTQRAMQEFDDAGDNATRLILERAKPIQVILKEWSTRLPKDLKMDNGNAPATIGMYKRATSSFIAEVYLGHLHLAYFATEITLHRCIIRSLGTTSTDIYLTHVCRSAAKARLISAMNFVNRLRPSHLTAFWYFPSRVNFALIATFGSLLLATAPSQEEAGFYSARLNEYRWTLSVSAKSAGFLNFAIESLESSTGLLKDMPEKPKIEDLDVRQVPPPPPPPPLTRLIPPQEEDEDDETMQDGYEPHSQPMPAPDSASSATEMLLSPSTASAWSAPATYGPYIGPFAGLGARDWFEQAHHGSPEAERMGLWAG